MEELARGSEGGVNASPHEDQNTADSVDQAGEPIPSVSVHHNVEVAGDHGTGRDKNADTGSVIDVSATLVDKVCWCI